jgi:imidazoleglycerol-phosphate dehydratase/histidinol-phosphatase
MKVAFIDRDGTLVYEPKDGLVRPDDLRILPGVIDALKGLKAKGYQLVMVTNQDFTKTTDHSPFFDITQKMLIEQLAKEGVAFDTIFLCPHSPTDGCNCRKPKPGMVTQYLKDNLIDRKTSIMVGDREEADGGLAKAIGVRYVKVGPNGQFASIETLTAGI